VDSGRGSGALRLELVNPVGIADAGGNPPAGLPIVGPIYAVDKGGTITGAGEGRPDPAFGSGGYVAFSDVPAVTTAGAIAVLADGRILAAGGAGCNASTGSDCRLQLARYAANGVPDPSFGTAGKVSTSLVGMSPILGGLAIAGDGSMFVSGARVDVAAALVPFIAKYDPDGTPSVGFGSGGVVELTGRVLGYPVTGMVIDAAGRILIAGTLASEPGTGQDGFVARFTTTGALDTTFAGSGFARFAPASEGAGDDRLTDIAVQPDGRLVVAGHSTGPTGRFDYLAMRLDAAGVPDGSFGTSGIVRTRFAGSGDHTGRKLALGQDGGITIVGGVEVAGTTHCGIARYRADGSPETAFGTSGQILVSLAEGCHEVTFQADGKLLVAATDRDADVRYATLLRLLADGAPDASFGSNGVQDVSSYGVAPRAAVSADGDVVTSVVIEDPADGIRKSMLLRLDAQLVDTTPPSAPSGLSATANGAFTVTLAWGPATDNDGVAGYRVERCQGVSCTNFAEIGSTTGLDLSDTGLSAGSTYRYRVRAFDNAGNPGTYSPTAQATTAAAPDSSPPLVTSTTPANGATGFSRTGNVTATFSEPMDAASINTSTFVLSNGTSTITATVSYNATSRVATLNPSSSLAYNTLYTATVLGGLAGVRDVAGNPLAQDHEWTFRTIADTTAPTVSSTSPAAGATGVSRTANVRVTFSEPMDPATIDASTIQLRDASNAVVPAVLTYDAPNRRATLNPDPTLAPLATYTATVRGGATGVKDGQGNALAADRVWSFSTRQ
jgi:uncharacterized delta-60 repeat protein